MEIKIIPITKWVGKKNENPRSSQFRATYKDTMKILKFELEKADIHGDAQLQMFYRPQDMRLDGNLRANAKPYEQGVKLVFQRLAEKFFDKKDQKWKYRLKTVSYPCDAFDSWQDNLRGIALSMEAFRKIERYGVFKYGDIMERLALPSSNDKNEAQEAAEFIANYSDYPPHAMGDKEFLNKAYKQAVARLHPDKSDDPKAHEKFLELQRAKEILEKHFSEKK